MEVARDQGVEDDRQDPGITRPLGRPIHTRQAQQPHEPRYALFWAPHTALEPQFGVQLGPVGEDGGFFGISRSSKIFRAAQALQLGSFVLGQAGSLARLEGAAAAPLLE
ncbi:MAG TPA: hypothetical protein VF171_03270 [Trueperaceae bacterium]